VRRRLPTLATAARALLPANAIPHSIATLEIPLGGSLSSTSAIPSPLIAFLAVCCALRARGLRIPFAPRLPPPLDNHSAHLFSTPSTRAASVGSAPFDFPTLNFYLP
ncbi:hypothetical protein FB107DRAFT_203427, partial [Schizophyllum commune]